MFEARPPAPGIRRRPGFALIRDFEWKEILARPDRILQAAAVTTIPDSVSLQQRRFDVSVNWETWLN